MYCYIGSILLYLKYNTAMLEVVCSVYGAPAVYPPASSPRSESWPPAVPPHCAGCLL